MPLSPDEYTEEIFVFKSHSRGEQTRDELRTTTLNFDSQKTELRDIRTPDPPSPLTSQLERSDFRPVSLRFTVARSNNQRTTSTVDPLTVSEPENHSNNISIQTLTIGKPKLSINNSTVEAIAVEDDEITTAPVFTQNADTRIEQKVLRNNKIMRRKNICKCKTCSIEIDGTAAVIVLLLQ